MDRVKTLLERILEYTMAALLAVMVIMVFGNVVLRYLFGSGIASAEEISRLMFVWLVFLGATLALRQHKHLGLELLQARLPVPVRRVCAIISHLLILYALWLFLSGSWTQTKIGLTTYSTVLRFPMAFYAAAGVFPAIAMILLVLINLYRIITGSPDGYMPGDPNPDHILDDPGKPDPAPIERVGDPGLARPANATLREV
ncbi:TRAP transporter small permease [Pleomorphomonas diazotrophica]|uniref:TRAP transporter small permease protein n=1 Tax=Pleomorphomonas diazotrophica TaxID=1166257 RepID=A0A1I4WSH4_9HYPH|nr:TRAP transporter small permease [Pleomorphomonas diazotrophica]PKR87319.1 TRAP transporter small permease [Pleomorphomonas diazotrophica]SFN16232.1 TRAP-type C4-dicarboxylate transport system, small permease component [Pleomorphomonas diazotrophica]